MRSFAGKALFVLSSASLNSLRTSAGEYFTEEDAAFSDWRSRAAQVLSVEEAYSPPQILHEIAPPARRDLAVTMTAARDGGAASGRRLAGYLLAGAIGAALATLWTRRRS